MLQEFRKTALIITGIVGSLLLSDCVSIPVVTGMKTRKEYRNDVRKEKEVSRIIKQIQKEAQENQEANKVYAAIDSIPKLEPRFE